VCQHGEYATGPGPNERVGLRQNDGPDTTVWWIIGNGKKCCAVQDVGNDRIAPDFNRILVPIFFAR